MITAMRALAVRAVRCPLCPARGGQYCRSTGGGNFQLVATHQVRHARIKDWDAPMIEAAAEAVRHGRGRDTIGAADFFFAAGSRD